jgi:flagellar hook-basal body complex protein FliE
MSLPIHMRNTPIDGAGLERMTPAADHDAKSDGVNFGDALSDAFKSANTLDKQSDDMATKFANGDPNIGIHEVMIASEKSTIALRYAVTLKNKALEAYKDLMNTPL